MVAAIGGVGAGVGAVQTMTGASARAPVQQKMSNLFNQIDSAGSGSVSAAQFAKQFQSLNPPAGFKAMGANAVFAKLDPGQTGSVSKSDFVSGMTALSQSLSAPASAPASVRAPGAVGAAGGTINTTA